MLKFLPWWANLIILGVVLGTLYGLKHAYDERRRDEGRAEYAPVMQVCDTTLTARTITGCAEAIAQAAADRKQLEANYELLKGASEKQNARIAALAAAAAQAKARAKQAEDEAASNAALYAERLGELQARIDKPSENPNADADRTLRDYARDRRVQRN